MFPLYLIWWRMFYHEWELNFIRWFFSICWDDCVVFVLYFIWCRLICKCWAIPVTLGWIQLGYGVCFFVYVFGFGVVMFQWEFFSSKLSNLDIIIIILLLLIIIIINILLLYWPKFSLLVVSFFLFWSWWLHRMFLSMCPPLQSLGWV